MFILVIYLEKNNAKQITLIMDISNEPMDIDLSSNSIKKDVSNCDSEESVVSRISPRRPATDVKATKSKRRRRRSSFLDAAPACLQMFIKQEPVDDDSKVTLKETETRSSVPQTVKKYHIIIQRDRTQKSNWVLKFSFLVALLAIVVIYYANSIGCIDELNTSLIKNTLVRKVYGQATAIALLVKSLEVKVSSKILFLFGGTGVGKTYAVSLMLDKAWNSSNVFHYVMPSFLENFPNDLLLGMSFCKSSILIVDDLTPYDWNIIEQMQNVILKSENLKKNITVILIYNLDKVGTKFLKNTDTAFFELELKENFGHIDAYKEYIKFETLTEEHLKMCIKSELQVSNVENMEKIIKNFNVTLDGCKNVQSKIKVLNVR